MKEQSVLQYSDYRTFLLEYYQERKKKNRNFSLTSWSRNLKVQDKSTIGKILTGKRHPGDELVQKLIRYFKFDQEESAYFQDLVSLHKVKKNPRLATLIMDRLESQGIEGFNQEYRSYQILKRWYVLAIREMIQIERFQEDSSWISSIFHFKVTPHETKKAIQILLENELLSRNDLGELVLAHKDISFKGDYLDMALRNYHETQLTLAQQALEKFQLSEREFGTTLLVMDSNQVQEAKKMIREFRKKFSKRFENLQTENGEVYQIQMQFFPLTKISENHKES